MERGGSIAAGCGHTMTVSSPTAMKPVQAMEHFSKQIEAQPEAEDIEIRLSQAWEKLERAAHRASHAEEETRRCLQAVRSMRGSVRVLARTRPRMCEEEEDDDCLRVVGRTQLEITIESRTSPTTTSFQLPRARRRTTGGLLCEASPRSRAQTSEDCEGDEASTARASLETRPFFFDQVFDSQAGEDDVFGAVREDVLAAVDGEAVCIMTYGASGSGKTHTMMGMAELAVKELEREVARRAKDGNEVEVAVQAIEVYNDELRDLLATPAVLEGECAAGEVPSRLKLTASNSSPALLGAVSRTFTLGGSREEALSDALEVASTADTFVGHAADDVGSQSHVGLAASVTEILQKAQRDVQRGAPVAETQSRLSRAHLVVTLLLTCHGENANGAAPQAGKLCLIDLASSDRMRKGEGLSGESLREAQHITRSLNALADVIVARERRCTHVPYRNSKLTHLLQDALGGRAQSRTVVLLTLSPTRRASAESLHSLQFGARLSALSKGNVQSGLANGPGSAFSPTVQGSRRLSLCMGEAARLRSLEEEEAAEEANIRAEVQRLRLEINKQRPMLKDQMQRLEERDHELNSMLLENAELSRAADRGTKVFKGLSEFNNLLQQVEATALNSARDLLSSASYSGPEPGNSCPIAARTARSRAQKDETQPWRASPPMRPANRSGSGVLNACRIQPVLRTSRSVGYDPAPRPANSITTAVPSRSPPPRAGSASSTERSAIATGSRAGLDSRAAVPAHGTARGTEAQQAMRSPPPRARPGPQTTQVAPSARQAKCGGDRRLPGREASRRANGGGSLTATPASSSRQTGARKPESSPQASTERRKRTGVASGNGAALARAGTSSGLLPSRRGGSPLQKAAPRRREEVRVPRKGATSQMSPKESCPPRRPAQSGAIPGKAAASSTASTASGLGSGAVSGSASCTASGVSSAASLRTLPNSMRTLREVPPLCLGGLGFGGLVAADPVGRSLSQAGSCAVATQLLAERLSRSSSPSEDSSSAGFTSSSSSSPERSPIGTPMLRQRDQQARGQGRGLPVSLKLDLSKVLPAGVSGPAGQGGATSRRQPMFGPPLALPPHPLPTPSTPRGRELVRWQECTSAAGAPPPTARGTPAGGMMTARSMPPPKAASAASAAPRGPGPLNSTGGALKRPATQNPVPREHPAQALRPCNLPLPVGVPTPLRVRPSLGGASDEGGQGSTTSPD
mmetsp:Transcript_105710/g.203120  ORF Transcript_105710/g.203120 Transcript_105710/m.203120 type:complete len:1207 (+) Transcript_105710:2-3622(+)